jgi:hypothetical protein
MYLIGLTELLKSSWNTCRDIVIFELLGFTHAVKAAKQWVVTCLVASPVCA